MSRSPERQQFLADVITTGVEGGIGYWARVIDRKRSLDLDWLEITVVEWESAIDELGLSPYSYDQLDDVTEGSTLADAWIHHVDRDKVASAIRRIIKPGSDISLAEDYVERIALANRLNDAGEIDALDADAIIQVAALGDVVYG
jgi:hypothetical protein